MTLPINDFLKSSHPLTQLNRKHSSENRDDCLIKKFKRVWLYPRKHIKVKSTMKQSCLSTFFNSDIWLRMKVEPTYIYRRVSTLKLGCLFYLKIRLLYHNITSVERNHQNWIWHQPKFNFVFNVDFNVESTLAIRRWLRWFNVDITSTDINMHQSWVLSEIIIFII